MNGQTPRSVVYSCLLNIDLFLKVKGELSLSYLNPPTYIQQACMRDCSQTFGDSLCDRGRSRDCCFDEINVSDNWWWELITGTIICVWSVYICSLCPFRSSPALWAPWWAAPSPVIQPGISHIYHIHYDHNVTVGTHRSEREMARTILSLFKLSRK